MKTLYFLGKLNKAYLLLLLLFMMCLTQTGKAQQTFSFTTAGATGRFGPTQGQVSNAYLNTNLNTLVTATGGIQTFTLSGGLFRISAFGAQGGSNPNYMGGLGSSMEGDFNLPPGTVINILVGQRGEVITALNNSGGGGGSFVWINSQPLPLIVAGGGGGCAGGPAAGANGVNASTTTAGTAGTGIAGTAGIAGNGANPGGGGWLTSGTNYTGNASGCIIKCTGNILDLIVGGASPATTILYHGCSGTTVTGDGGFGGGSGGAGGCTYFYGGGGGGGYSGGVGQSGNSAGGGGGGSYNSGTNQLNAAAANSGDGKVIIKELCNITLTATGVNSSNAVCAGNSVTLTTNAVSNYSWSTGATTSSIVVSPSSTTIYTLGATSQSACTAQASFTVIVNPAVPSLTVVNTANAGGICPTKSVNLTASGATTYTWTGGSPTVTNGVTFNPTVAHDYTVTGGNACGTSSAVTSVSVHPPPTVNPSASNSTLCAGNGLTLTATGNATNYIWSGGSAPSGNGIGFVPPASTITYTAIGTSALSCTAQATIPVTVHATPNAAPAANPSLICVGNSSTLTAMGATSHTWASATQTVFTNPFIVTPSSQGVSTYTLIQANSTCSDTKMISITTNSLPGIFAMVTPSVVCALKPATLSVGGGISYTWTAPGTPNFSFTGASPVVYPQAPAEYTVAASDGTCISVTTVSLAVDPNPTITIAASAPSICAGSAVTMTAQGGSSYTWTSSSSSNTLYTQTISESPIIATSYNVTGDNSFGCTATANQVIIVHNSPTLAVTVSKNLVCSGDPSTLTVSGANTYTWDPNNVLMPTIIVNPVALTSGPVEYTVNGSFTATGCKATKTVQVNVFVPVLTVSGNTATCSGGQISLSALGGNANTYTWNTGTSTSNLQNITTTLTAPAIFTVSATGTSVSINSAICPATQTVAVGIHSNPPITAVQGRTTMICTGESVELHAEGGLSYTWNNSQTGPTITVKPPLPTNNYVVTGTDVNGCTASATVQVKISACTGVGELNTINSALSICPNPNNGTFIIKTDFEMDLVLVSELGQIIETFSLSASNNYTVSVTGLAKGIYFVSGQGYQPGIRHKLVVTE